MNYSNLYKHTQYYEDPRVEIYTKVKGWLKKKKEETIGFKKKIGLNQGSKQKFFCFFQRGRILAYFSEEPKDTQKLENIIYTHLIKELQENFSGKEDHFMIIVKEEHIHIKCDNKAQREQWIKAIKFFREYYSKETNQLSKELMEEVDLETKIRINKEIEINNWQKISKHYDHTKFIRDKNLQNLFEENPIEVLTNRILIAQIVKETKKRKQGKKEGEPQTPFTPLTPALIQDRFKLQKIKMKKGSHYHIFLVAQRPICVTDEEFYNKDNVILDKESLPQNIEFNTIYFFEYKDEGDMSRARKQCNISEIEAIIIDKDFSLKLQLKDKYYILTFKSAWETIMWLEGLQNTSEYYRDQKRSKYGIIKHNIAQIYRNFNLSKDDENLKIIQNFFQNFNVTLQSDEFNKRASEICQQWKHFCDAFYSHKPFLDVLFKFCALNFHTKMIQILNKYWNKQIVYFKPVEVLGFLQLMNMYLSILQEWKIKTQKIDITKPMITTFLSKINKKSSEILNNILTDFKKNVVTEKGKIKSKSEENMETHLNTIFENYAKLPNKQTAELLVEYCGMQLYYFFSNAKSIMERDRLTMEVYIAVLNNTYQRTIKQFLKKVHRSTKSEVPLKQSKIIVKEQYLITVINDMEKISMSKFEKEIKNMVLQHSDDDMFGLIEDQAEEFEQILKKIKNRIDLLQNKFHYQTILNHVFELFPQLYYNIYIASAQYISINNYVKVGQKMKEFQKNFREFLEENYIEKKQQQILNHRIGEIVKYFLLEDPDQVVVSLMNIFAFYPNLMSSANLDIFLKTKVLFPPESLTYIRDSIWTTDSESMKNIKVENIEIKSLSINSKYYYLYPSQVVQKEKAVLKKKNNQVNQEMPKITTENTKMLQSLKRVLYTNQDILQTKGWLKMLKFSAKLKENQVENFIKKQLVSEKDLKKRYVFFKPGGLNFSKETVGKQIIDVILYKDIKIIEMLSTTSFYFVTDKTGFAFFFKNYTESNAKIWYEYLKILKQRNNSKKPKIETIDITNDDLQLKWKQININYYYKFEEKKYHDTNFQIDQSQISVNDDEDISDDE